MFEGELGVPKSEHRAALQRIIELETQLSRDQSRVKYLVRKLDEERQKNEDAMHKETALLIELEKERRRKKWCFNNSPVVMYEKGKEYLTWKECGWHQIRIFDSDTDAAVDEAMKGRE